MHENSIRNQPHNSHSYSPFDNFFVKLTIKIGKMTPRVAIAGISGYYVLGYAYANGWMMAIDQAAIKVMRHYGMGYIAIGALMPNVQWYAAWGVRVTAGLVAGIIYSIAEKVVILSIRVLTPGKIYKRQPSQVSLLSEQAETLPVQTK